MENIFSLIVILIMVLSVFSKLKAKIKTKQGTTTKGGGWITKFNAFLSDIKHKIEQQAKEGAAGASGWDQLIDGGEEFSSPSDTDEAVPGDLVFEDAETPPFTKKMSPAAPVRAQATRSDKTHCVPRVTGRKTGFVSKPSHMSMVACRADLRKAVIWAEILGPPIALKDPFDGRK